jgi:hypothetical protein
MRFFTTSLLIALVLAPAGFGKEGVEARFLTPLPFMSAPGETVELEWTLTFDENGEKRPFNASGVYVRLVSASGGEATEGYAHPGAHADGHYSAAVTVPEGGVGEMQVGLQGTMCTASGCSRSDAFFPVVSTPAEPLAARPPVLLLASAFLGRLF